MTRTGGTGRGLGAFAVAAVAAVAACGAPSAGPGSVAATDDPAADIAEIRVLETDRLRVMVDGDIEAARGFYAMDYELVDPVGDLETLEDYLGLLESGRFDYVRWEPTDEIEVRAYGDVAAIRYPSVIDVVLDGQPIEGAFWQSAILERRDGNWQHVWGQTTPMS